MRRSTLLRDVADTTKRWVAQMERFSLDSEAAVRFVHKELVRDASDAAANVHRMPSRVGMVHHDVWDALPTNDPTNDPTVYVTMNTRLVKMFTMDPCVQCVVFNGAFPFMWTALDVGSTTGTDLRQWWRGGMYAYGAIDA
jgi:hypothetical protein